MPPLFANRRDAGRALALLLGDFRDRADAVVLGLPRGGVPVAYQVARDLNVALDVFVVRKLGLPGHEELAMGAIASGGIRVLNEDVVRYYGVTPEVVDTVAAREHTELERRERLYRGQKEPHPLTGQTVLLVDDGLATGATMRAAVMAARSRQPARVIVAAPVGAPATCRALRSVADAVVCAREPERFSAVGEWYGDFSQTTDDEVRDLLRTGEDTTP